MNRSCSSISVRSFALGSQQRGMFLPDQSSSSSRTTVLCLVLCPLPLCVYSSVLQLCVIPPLWDRSAPLYPSPVHFKINQSTDQSHIPIVPSPIPPQAGPLSLASNCSFSRPIDSIMSSGSTSMIGYLPSTRHLSGTASGFSVQPANDTHSLRESWQQQGYRPRPSEEFCERVIPRIPSSISDYPGPLAGCSASSPEFIRSKSQRPVRSDSCLCELRCRSPG